MVKYIDIKNKINKYYNSNKKIDIDNIGDINDKLVDDVLGLKSFEDPEEELFNTIAMCNYMIEHNLYDEYFFESAKDIIDDYQNGKVLSLTNDEILDKDIDIVKDYIEKDKYNEEYYNKLSDVYNNENK
jgi:hypothetical protein